MEFCPVCKSLLLIKEENGKNIGYCSCGFKRMSGVEISSSETNDIEIKKTMCHPPLKSVVCNRHLFLG